MPIGSIARVGRFKHPGADRLNGIVLLAHMDGSATPDVADPYYGTINTVTSGAVTFTSPHTDFGTAMTVPNADGSTGKGVQYTFNTPSVGVPQFTPPFMADMWLYPTTPTVNGQFFVSLGGSGGSVNTNAIAAGGLWSFGFVSGDTTVLNANQWNHIVLGATSTQRFYGSNGVIRSVATVPSIGSMDLTTLYAVGNSTFTGPGMKVDEVCLRDYLPPEFENPVALNLYTVPTAPYTP